MAGGFGDFGALTDAFMAAAVDPTRWDAAMDAAARATDSLGAILLPVRGRTQTVPTSRSMLPTMEAYAREGWAHKDERYRSLPVFMRRGVAWALDAFEASHSPVAMINRMGEAVRLNRSAERLLGPDLKIVGRCIVSSSRDATQALDRALHDLIWLRSAESCRPPVVLPRQNGRPIVAYPSRLSAAVGEGFALARGFVVFVDLAARPPAVAAELMRVFGLTPAEARLADRLLGKESLEAAAESLGVSYFTARNQLKAIYQKTETHSQGQLIVLISRLAKPQIPGA